MSKKKAAVRSTMTLKDFHGGTIPSDLPLPSAPGMTVERSVYERQSSNAWSNSPFSRNYSGDRSSYHRQGSSNGIRTTLEDKAAYFPNPANIGRNYDEDERKPVDGRPRSSHGGDRYEDYGYETRGSSYDSSVDRFKGNNILGSHPIAATPVQPQRYSYGTENQFVSGSDVKSRFSEVPRSPEKVSFIESGGRYSSQQQPHISPPRPWKAQSQQTAGPANAWTNRHVENNVPVNTTPVMSPWRNQKTEPSIADKTGSGRWQPEYRPSPVAFPPEANYSNEVHYGEGKIDARNMESFRAVPLTAERAFSREHGMYQPDYGNVNYGDAGRVNYNGGNVGKPGYSEVGRFGLSDRNGEGYSETLRLSSSNDRSHENPLDYGIGRAGDRPPYMEQRSAYNNETVHHGYSDPAWRQGVEYTDPRIKPGSRGMARSNTFAGRDSRVYEAETYSESFRVDTEVQSRYAVSNRSNEFEHTREVYGIVGHVNQAGLVMDTGMQERYQIAEHGRSFNQKQRPYSADATGAYGSDMNFNRVQKSGSTSPNHPASIPSVTSTENARGESALVRSDSNERPRLKLLPRSKPVVKGSEDAEEATEGSTEKLMQEVISPTPQLEEKKVENIYVDVPSTEGSGNAAKLVPNVGLDQDINRPIERPKLNLKPRSQPVEGIDDGSQKERISVFGGARPRELVLKERGADDNVVAGIDAPAATISVSPRVTNEKQETLHVDKREKRVDDKQERQFDRLEKGRSFGRQENRMPDSGRGQDRQEAQVDSDKYGKRDYGKDRRRDREQDKQEVKRDIDKQESWRRPMEPAPPAPSPQPASALVDVSPRPGPRYGTTASAMELAQAFSRSASINSALVASPRVNGQRGGQPGIVSSPSRAPGKGYGQYGNGGAEFFASPGSRLMDAPQSTKEVYSPGVFGHSNSFPRSGGYGGNMPDYRGHALRSKDAY